MEWTVDETVLTVVNFLVVNVFLFVFFSTGSSALRIIEMGGSVVIFAIFVRWSLYLIAYKRAPMYALEYSCL